MLMLFALALGLRVLYPAVFSEHTELSSQHITVDFDYARTIASGFEWIGTPLFPRSPGYPVLLAGFYLAAAKQVWLMLFFQAILGAITVVLAYRIAAQLLGTRAGVVAALWYAFSVNHIRVVGIFHRDILAILLVVLMLYLLTRPFQSVLWGITIGVVYGALIHVHPIYMLFFPVFAVLILFKTRHKILNVQYLFLFTTALIVFSTPWAIRNGIVYGQPFPVGLEATRYLRPARIAVGDGQQLSELERKITTASRSGRIGRNISEFWRVARFKDTVRVSPVTGAPETTPAWSTRHNLVSIATYGVLLPFLIIGVVGTIRSRNRTAIMLVLFLVWYTLVRAYFHGNVRTRMPVDPVIIILAFYGILVLKERFLPRAPQPPTKD